MTQDLDIEAFWKPEEIRQCVIDDFNRARARSVV
jgi:hypothetical protein